MKILLKIFLFLPLFIFGQNTYQIAILKYKLSRDTQSNIKKDDILCMDEVKSWSPIKAQFEANKFT